MVGATRRVAPTTMLAIQSPGTLPGVRMPGKGYYVLFLHPGVRSLTRGPLGCILQAAWKVKRPSPGQRSNLFPSANGGATTAMETSPRQIHLRTNLKPGDIGQVIYLHGTLYAQEYHWDHTFEGYVAEGLARFALSYEPHRDRLWIAELDGQIVGCVAIVGLSESEAQLRWFLVHPACRGQGLGRQLLREALHFCREHGFKSISLWTVSGLHAAAHLYQSAGFDKTEEKTHQIWGHLLTEEKYCLSL
jgi:N-acetylglutamate synthase-like GNAT family acetyltransferase